MRASGALVAVEGMIGRHVVPASHAIGTEIVPYSRALSPSGEAQKLVASAMSKIDTIFSEPLRGVRSIKSGQPYLPNHFSRMVRSEVVYTLTPEMRAQRFALNASAMDDVQDAVALLNREHPIDTRDHVRVARSVKKSLAYALGELGDLARHSNAPDSKIPWFRAREASQHSLQHVGDEIRYAWR